MVKDPPANAGDIKDVDSIPGRENALEEGWHGNTLQYSCPQNPMDKRSLVGYSSQNLKESDTTEAT